MAVHDETIAPARRQAPAVHPSAIQRYCEAHSTPPNEVLRALERETHLKTLSPQMLTGHLQGQLLSMISKWLRPELVLEIGTFTGYGAICLASGLVERGIVHTIEVNPEYSHISQKYFALAGLQRRIKQHIGDAAQVIPHLDEGMFDLVYLDAGKQDYALHYDLVLGKVRDGGVILVDNVLWSGKVGTDTQDKDTIALESFNQKVQNDDRVENLLLPIRDGLMIIFKK